MKRYIHYIFILTVGIILNACEDSFPIGGVPSLTNDYDYDYPVVREYVDLGLTSGTLWATCNIGAKNPEDYGSYFAWGETTTKSSYTESNYNFTSNPSTLPADKDAARANWGDSWSMPTTADFKELDKECTWTWTTMNGKNGYKVSSKKNSSYIFLPAAGIYASSSSSSLFLEGSCGYYWSSSLYASNTSYAYVFIFDSRNINPSYHNSRFDGLSVRPVIRKKTSDEELDDKVFTVSGVTFKMKPVEGGTFQMGATPEQEDPYDDEKPVHSVTLSSYYIGETEVTQELWEVVTGNNPSYHKGSSNPVEQVTWDDCQAFIQKLNSLTGKTFRLPTEAEWEYAARGGNKSRGYQYSGSNAIGDVAWYVDNSSGTTHPVKTKQPNELGIYDMSGNVSEWCQDWYGSYSSSSQTNPTGPSSGLYRVRRGGSWGNDAWDGRSSSRDCSTPGYANINLGLRLVFSE